MYVCSRIAVCSVIEFEADAVGRAWSARAPIQWRVGYGGLSDRMTPWWRRWLWWWRWRGEWSTIAVELGVTAVIGVVVIRGTGEK